VDTELDQDALDVRGNRLRAENELAGDRLLAGAVSEQREDVALALRQTEGLLPALAVTSYDEPGADEQPAHARKQLVRVERLEEVVVGAEEEAGDAVGRLPSAACRAERRGPSEPSPRQANRRSCPVRRDTGAGSRPEEPCNLRDIYGRLSRLSRTRSPEPVP
jgi:hypothetical protein